MKRLRVMMTRREIVPETLSGSVAVVLDVILATTTLVTIFENGARRVFVAGSVEEAERICEPLDRATLIRGGEQGGFMVGGYDLGPLPEEYPPEVVAGKDVVFVTTNGTRALAAAHEAEKVLVGSVRNAPAVARYLDSLDEDAYLVCAGSRGRFGMEDFAGAAEIISHMNLEEWKLGDSALLALDFAERHAGDPLEAVSRGRAGRWFIESGLEKTLRFAAEVGASEVVPELKDDLLRAVGDPVEIPDFGG